MNFYFIFSVGNIPSCKGRFILEKKKRDKIFLIFFFSLNVICSKWVSVWSDSVPCVANCQGFFAIGQGRNKKLFKLILKMKSYKTNACLFTDRFFLKSLKKIYGAWFALKKKSLLILKIFFYCRRWPIATEILSSPNIPHLPEFILSTLTPHLIRNSDMYTCYRPLIFIVVIIYLLYVLEILSAIFPH